MITRSPRTSSKVLLLIAATLWIARVVELSRALSLRIIFPCWWTQVCRRPSASLDDSQRRLAERAGCILLPIHTHAIAWLGLGHAPHRNFEAENQASVSPSHLPQLFRFLFCFGGGTPPREIYSVLHSQPEISVGGVRRERGWEGGRLVFFLFSEVGVVEEVLSNGRTAEPRKPRRRHREPRPHKSGTRARPLLLDQHTSRPTAPPPSARDVCVFVTPGQQTSSYQPTDRRSCVCRRERTKLRLAPWTSSASS